MTDDPGVAGATEPASSGRPAGFVLGLGSIIMVAFMALHPTVHAHGAAGLASEMSRVAVRNAVVHGTLIANLGLILLGLLGLADRRGLARMLVRAGIIAAAQKVEHYEIAAYGTLCTWAKQLGFEDAAELLGETLEEEKQTDEKLSQLAESEVNLAAE